MVVFSAGPYYIPNLDIEGNAWFTNNLYSGSMRGFGTNQVTMAMEQNIDEMARVLNMDPFDFRLLNALDSGLPTASDHVLFGGEVTIKDTIMAAKQASLELKKLNNKPNKKYGIGVACSMKNIGFGHNVPESAGQN